jgi:hypothetical protein
MWQKNLELVRAGGTSICGHRAAAELPAPRLAWHVRGDFSRCYRGHDQFRKLGARFDEIFDQQCEPLGFIDAERDVVVPLRSTAWGRLSGAIYIERFETGLAVEDDSIRTVGEFATNEAALEAVALRG